MKKKTPKRPPWEQYFLNLAKVVRERSNCLRQQVGVVLVKNKRIIATGYNGTPAGIKNCFDGGCKRCSHRHSNKMKVNERKDLCICVHAEENALLQSAFHGVSSKDAIMYSTIAPCAQCAKSIINAGVAKVVYSAGHTDDFGLKLLKQGRVVVQKYSK